MKRTDAARVRATGFTLLFSLVAVATLAIGIWTMLPSQGAAPSVQTTSGKVPSAQKTQPTPAEVEKVFVGEHLNQVLGIDLETGTYTVDFYLWLTWNGPIDPSTSIDFVNSVGDPAKFAAFYPEPIKQSDGSNYQGWHVQGTFVNILNFQEFPRDRHTLVFQIEDNTYNSSQLEYVQTTVTQGAEFLAMPEGWQLAGAPEAAARDHTYDTKFGAIDQPGNASYSQLTVGTPISKPVSGYLAGSILPIIVVLLIVFVAYFLPLPLAMGDSRMAVGVTSLISAVLLRNGAVSGLPDVPYLVRIDMIFLCAYVVIFVAIAHSVFSVRMAKVGKEELGTKVGYWLLGGSAITFFAVMALALFAGT